MLDLALNSKIQLFLSLEILHEYEGVLQRKKFGLDPALLAESLALIRKKARLVSPKHRVTVASDPEDNKFLECAEEAMADYLVTGEQTAVPKALEGYLGRQCP